MLPTMARADAVQDALVKSYEAERSQQYDEAVTALLSARKQTYLVNMRLGWLHYLRGDYASSKQFYQAAMRMAPKSVEPRLGYTLPLMAEQKWQEVEAVCKTILGNDAHQYTAALRLTTALRIQGKFRPARDLNAGMLELYPTDVSFLAEQLVCSAALKQLDVKQLIEAILALDPENATAKAYLPTVASRSK
ncbi:MAG: hypothetical protein C0483_21455 [Pirellula sp.]|nr:hypothetical protein [Pirellula sp.]